MTNSLPLSYTELKVMPESPALEINILESIRKPDTPVSRFLDWALTWGRYIVVFTELIVILAFLSRFKLDQQITDLEETLSQKQLIIEASRPIEETLINTQNKISLLKNLDKKSRQPELLLNTLNAATPVDVMVTTFTLTETDFSLTAKGNEPGLATFIDNLKKSPNISELSVKALSKSPGDNLFQFIIAATYAF